MIVEFECPKCKGHVCEIWALNGSNFGIRVMYWHMILNPGLAFNELILGQRFPSRTYVCKACELPLVERSFVHCPECDSFHDAGLWSGRNAFGLWLGLFCPSCGGEIPCLRNLTTRLVSLVTLPIWWLPLKACKAKFIPSQQLRIARAQSKYLVQSNSSERKPINYVQMGLSWALCMDLIMSFISAAGYYDWQHGGWLAFAGVYFMTLLRGLMLWLPAGAIFALLCKFSLDRLLNFYVDRKGDKKLHITYDSDGQVIPLKFDDEPEDSKG